MYFVMIHTSNAEQPAIPLLKPDTDDCTDIAFFETEDEAFIAAMEDKYCARREFDVFELGNGVI